MTMTPSPFTHGAAGAPQLPPPNRYGQIDLRAGLVPAGFVLLDDLPANEFDLRRLGIECGLALLGFEGGRPVEGWLIAEDWPDRIRLRQRDERLERELLRARIIRRGRQLGLSADKINLVLRRRGFGGAADELPEERIGA